MQPIVLPRNGDGLRALQPALAVRLARLNVGPRLVYRAELVAEEIFTNLVKHAQARGGNDVVTLAVWQQNKPAALTLMIEDRTMSFSPIWTPEPRVQTDLATAQPGGLGLSLVRQSCDQLDYESLPNVNRLVARFDG